MTKWKRFKARVIDHLVITDEHITMEVVIESCRKNLYVACLMPILKKAICLILKITILQISSCEAITMASV